MPDKIKGFSLYASVDGVPVGCSKSCDITITTKTADTTSKCDVSNGMLYNTGLPVSISWKITDSGFNIYNGVSGVTNEASGGSLIAKQIQGKKCFVTYQDANDLQFYGGDAWITSMKLTSPVEDVETYDLELTGNGPFVLLPVS